MGLCLVLGQSQMVYSSLKEITIVSRKFWEVGNLWRESTMSGLVQMACQGTKATPRIDHIS